MTINHRTRGVSEIYNGASGEPYFRHCFNFIANGFLFISYNKKDGYRQLNVRQLGSLRPRVHRDKCYMDRKRIQCLSNASQHVPINLQPFLKYSSGGCRGRGAAPIDLTNFCIKVKSHLRMHQNSPFSGKNSIFFSGDRPPPIIKFWIRH